MVKGRAVSYTHLDVYKRQSQHSGVVIVCDGSAEADKRIARVLWNDPGTGVMRHADAGYEIAKQCAKEQGLKLPMA